MNQISGKVKHLNVQEPKACGLQWVSEYWTSPGLKWPKPVVGLLNGQIFRFDQMARPELRHFGCHFV